MNTDEVIGTGCVGFKHLFCRNDDDDGDGDKGVMFASELMMGGECVGSVTGFWSIVRTRDGGAKESRKGRRRGRSVDFLSDEFDSVSIDMGSSGNNRRVSSHQNCLYTSL